MLYFAYGSNMSSPRLRERVGAVEIRGHAILPGHEHQFSKPGLDGTGKGHIAPHPRRRVHGVLYALDPAQLDTLTEYEGGYRRTTLTVLSPLDERALEAITFLALRPGDAPPPSPAYLEHYRRGFLEHALPLDYAQAVLRDAGDHRPL